MFKKLPELQSEESSRAERIVGTDYADFIAPLGALVILFVQAEQALTDLLKVLNGCSEAEASRMLDSKDAEHATKDAVARYDFLDRSALDEAVKDFWPKKQQRNRLMHHEWFLTFDPDGQINVVTKRGPRRKRADMDYQRPDPEVIWQLASDFREISTTFWIYAEQIKRGIASPVLRPPREASSIGPPNGDASEEGSTA